MEGAGQGNATLFGRSFVRAKLRMISLDAGVAGQVAVTFDLSSMAGVTCFWIPNLSLISYDGVNLLLIHLDLAVGDVVQVVIAMVGSGAVMSGD